MGPWLNGGAASADDLRALALSNYGHFTAMQVRGGGVQGLAFHIERLQQGSRELFAAELSAQRIRAELRSVVAKLDSDVSLRFTVYARGFDYRNPLRPVDLDILISVAPLSLVERPPIRVKSYSFVRPMPQLKHVGTFPLFHYRRQAQLAGFDDALFVDESSHVVEGSVWNIGFWDGEVVVWPQGPALRGSSEALLQAGLRLLGVAQRYESVALSRVGRYQAAFACNANGLQVVTGIDDTELPVNPALMRLLGQALCSQDWDTAY